MNAERSHAEDGCGPQKLGLQGQNRKLVHHGHSDGAAAIHLSVQLPIMCALSGVRVVLMPMAREGSISSVHVLQSIKTPGFSSRLLLNGTAQKA